MATSALTGMAGKTILISGGSSGIGAAVAHHVVQAGAKVVIGDIQHDKGTALALELGDSARFVKLDVTSQRGWSNAVQASVDFGGRLDGLVNSAGVYIPKPLQDTSIDLFERHVAINQTGVFLGMREAAMAMKRGRSGSIVNISSVAGLKGTLSFAYGATKWAVRGMTRSAALSLVGDNIRVNSVHPGIIETGLLHILSKDQAEQGRQKIPMGRRGEPDDVARAVLFLLSDNSSYVTGTEITVDGGMMA